MKDKVRTSLPHKFPLARKLISYKDSSELDNLTNNIVENLLYLQSFLYNRLITPITDGSHVVITYKRKTYDFGPSLTASEEKRRLKKAQYISQLTTKEAIKKLLSDIFTDRLEESDWDREVRHLFDLTFPREKDVIVKETLLEEGERIDE